MLIEIKILLMYCYIYCLLNLKDCYVGAGVRNRLGISGSFQVNG